jgi:hypothetical protein
MLQRGRKPAATLTALTLNADHPRLNPPQYLTNLEQTLFVELVASCPAKQFVLSDIPLLASYVQATILARGAVKEAAQDPRSLAVWEKATRMQATLATRLRLSPQSRVDPKVIGRNRSELPPSAYELARLADE